MSNNSPSKGPGTLIVTALLSEMAFINVSVATATSAYAQDEDISRSRDPLSQYG